MVGAVIGPMAQPRAVVLGLPVGGLLRIVGRSAALSAVWEEILPLPSVSAGEASMGTDVTCARGGTRSRC